MATATSSSLAPGIGGVTFETLTFPDKIPGKETIRECLILYTTF